LNRLVRFRSRCANFGGKRGGGTAGVVSKPPSVGRLGGEAHRGTVAKRALELESQGYTITGGGGRLPERSVITPEGRRRFPDISARDPNGSAYHENIGRSMKTGDPIARD
jgi:hypothetical protein